MNLCDTCTKHIATCKGTPTFEDEDNVSACPQYDFKGDGLKMLNLCDDCDNEDCDLRFEAKEIMVECDDYLVLDDDEAID